MPFLVGDEPRGKTVVRNAARVRLAKHLVAVVGDLVIKRVAPKSRQRQPHEALGGVTAKKMHDK